MLANILTFSRIFIAIFIPCFIFLGRSDFSLLDVKIVYFVSFILFILAALSDFLDGWIARKKSQESEIGRILDPVADKLLVILTLVPILINFNHILIYFPSIIIIFREILVSGLRESLKSNDLILEVTKLSKWKTASQLIAVSSLLLSLSFPILSFPIWINNLPLFMGLIFIWLASILSMVTGFNYIYKVVSFYKKEKV
ncbi:MAG: CDP-diacylglycerol--glycerol-3-phosphate 3-phosphatidyltransferase [Pseudomonadota bacterium]|nr:CDP-diacylglycerol--glycerol-3-phosphate 3-phosphatidyltransferase [Pseudomonadota bacterium]